MSGKKGGGGGGGKRDDSYFAAARRKNKNVRIIMIAVGVGIAVAIAAAVMAYSQSRPYGAPGSAHVHAGFSVMLNGQEIDFSERRYQVDTTGSRYIHMEGGDGTTLHRHATGVPIGEFLHTVRMDILNGCFILDNGSQYCEGGDNRLLSFVNGNEVQDIMSYVLNDDDRILITYGDLTEQQIQEQIENVRDRPLVGAS
jgi:hypothetical protein